MGIFSRLVMLPGTWLGTPGLRSRSATEWHSVILPPSTLAFPQQLSPLLFPLSDAEQGTPFWGVLSNGALMWCRCFGITSWHVEWQ